MHFSNIWLGQNSMLFPGYCFSEYFSVAFRVYFSGDPTVESGDILKFNRIQLNTGNGYLVTEITETC